MPMEMKILNYLFTLILIAIFLITPAGCVKAYPTYTSLVDKISYTHGSSSFIGGKVTDLINNTFKVYVLCDDFAEPVEVSGKSYIVNMLIYFIKNVSNDTVPIDYDTIPMPKQWIYMNKYGIEVLKYEDDHIKLTMTAHGYVNVVKDELKGKIFYTNGSLAGTIRTAYFYIFLRTSVLYLKPEPVNKTLRVEYGGISGDVAYIRTSYILAPNGSYVKQPSVKGFKNPYEKYYIVIHDLRINMPIKVKFIDSEKLRLVMLEGFLPMIMRKLADITITNEDINKIVAKAKTIGYNVARDELVVVDAYYAALTNKLVPILVLQKMNSGITIWVKIGENGLDVISIGILSGEYSRVDGGFASDFFERANLFDILAMTIGLGPLIVIICIIGLSVTILFVKLYRRYK